MSPAPHMSERSHGVWRCVSGTCGRCLRPASFIKESADGPLWRCVACPHTDLPDRKPTSVELAFLCRLRTYGGSHTDRGYSRGVVDACVAQDWCRVVVVSATPTGPRLLELSPTGRRLPGVVSTRKPRKGRTPRE